MRNFYYIIAIFTTLLISCSSDEPFLSDEQPIESNNIYWEFNKWVYSQMNQQYLWRDEIPDSVECDYELAPEEFFNSLISPNGRFSYITNPNYQSRISKKNVGFAYQLFSDIKGNEAMYVLYVNSLSAKNIGLHRDRGDFIKIKNITDSSVSLSRIHYTDETFFDNGETLDYNIQKFSDKANTVLLDTIFKRNKNIGYICYLEYGEVNDLIKPLKKSKQYGISDLILDLRYNPGRQGDIIKHKENLRQTKG